MMSKTNTTTSEECCSSLRNFRIRFCIIPIISLLIISFLTSILSTLDCKFLKIDFGFLPVNSIHTITRNITDDSIENVYLKIGLFSMEHPMNGKCLLPKDTIRIGSLTDDAKGNFYTMSLFNGDTFWGFARLFAILGLVFCFISLIISCVVAFSSRETKTPMKMTLFTFILLSLLCEGFKWFFFASQPCTSKTLWQDEIEQITHERMYLPARQCYLHRGSYLSLSSLIIYFLATILLLLHILRPRYNHESFETFEYDEISMPSFLKDIGESVVSSVLSAKSRMSKLSGVSKSSSRVGDEGRSTYQPQNSQMTPIIEEEV